MTAYPKLRQDLQHIVDSLETYGDLNKSRLDILRSTLFKKFLGTPKDESAKHTQALERFCATNERMKLFNRDFEPSILTQYMRDDLQSVFQAEDPLTLNICANLGKCGPGASFGHDGDVDFFTKMFDGPLTSNTEALIFHYRHVIDDRWLSAELFRAQRHPTIHVDGSKISSVPKDEKKRRCICVEPVLNMFYQLGAKTWLESVSKRRLKIDVATQQDHNRRMAREGSVSGRFSTIDLSDASDSISACLIKEVFPPDVYRTLDFIRCKSARVGKEWVPLHMFSTMGNGFTFILMTMLLSSLIRSVYHMHGRVPKANKNFAVFGDDLIVDTDMYPHVVSALTDLGFIPNQDKSFSTGFFRESCGGDYIRGFDVRGVYCKRLNNEADLYSLFNRLVRWSGDSGINIDCLLVRIVGELKDKILLVPPDQSDTAGIKCPAVVANASMHGYRYDYLKPRTWRISTKRRLRNNPDGATIAYIGGYFRRGTLSLRIDNPKFKLVTDAYTPSWDRREVWDDLCLTSSGVKCWSLHSDQEVTDLLFRVLIRAIIGNLARG